MTFILPLFLREMRTSFGQWDAEIIFHAVSSTKHFDRSSAVSQLSISFIRLITGCVAAVIGMSLLSRWSTRSSRFPARYLYNAGQRRGRESKGHFEAQSELLSSLQS